MWFDEKGEVLQGAQFCPSPNCDSRPAGELPSLIVVHGISLPPDQFGSDHVRQLFMNQLDPDEDPYFKKIQGLKVSAHFFIRRDGSILQFVKPQQRAWHAGVSQYHGRERCNDFAIGIELEGADKTPYTLMQYKMLAELVKALWKVFPAMPKEAIVGHNQIAPGRKTDPGRYFNWPALWRLLEVR